MHAPLPIDDVLPALRAALAATGAAVLQAPPGAGKTTRVPLDLLAARSVQGRIIMLEPRRLAARGAAERMAETLGEPVGQTVGYRMRGETRVGASTRIEVVTEGILTRMIQSDPELSGIGCVIFDEFHERSLQADLGLALTLEIRQALRPDLQIVVMSATLDASPVATMLGCSLITSAGQAFAVDTHWLARAVPAGQRLEVAAAQLVRQAISETSGGVLVFLPGESEINRVASLLSDLPCDIRPLFGAMTFAAQRAALAPAAASGPAPQRKIVLATAIAETSLTIPDIHVVVDAGRARRARYDPASGMSRLVTDRVTKAEADQRRGRAGRVAPGFCYRLWTKAEEGALAAFPPPEIMAADLTGLALELALWGADDLPFLTTPPAPALTEARALLVSLGALDGRRITAHGRALAALPLHPRLGHMLQTAGAAAAPLAALLADRDPLRSAPVDLTLRLRALHDPARFAAEHSAPVHAQTLDRIRHEAKRLARNLPAQGDLTPGQMAALAYPDRIGLRRKGDAPRWILSGGKGVIMAPADPLATARLIVVTDTDGNPRDATIRQALALTEDDLRGVFGAQICWQSVCTWSRRDGRVQSRRQECLGALVLADHHWDAPPDLVALAALDGLRDTGLPWTAAAQRLRARIRLAAGDDPAWPDVSDTALLAQADWLLPHLANKRSLADLRTLDLTEPLRGLLSWAQAQQLDTLVPACFETPLGRRVPIDYDGDDPGISLRLQELFGVTRHPTVGAQHLPLRLTLLSPAQAPVRVTRDLPGFWATSYHDVRRDMRGAYPRHPWPEDPTLATPTTRAKPRGT